MFLGDNPMPMIYFSYKYKVWTMYHIKKKEYNLVQNNAFSIFLIYNQFFILTIIIMYNKYILL